MEAFDNESFFIEDHEMEAAETYIFNHDQDLCYPKLTTTDKTPYKSDQAVKGEILVHDHSRTVRVQEGFIVLPPLRKISTPKRLKISRVFSKRIPQTSPDGPFILSAEALRSVEHLDFDTGQALALLTKALKIQSEPDGEVSLPEKTHRVVFGDITLHTLYPANTSRKRRSSSEDIDRDIRDITSIERDEFIPCNISDDTDLQRESTILKDSERYLNEPPEQSMSVNTDSESIATEDSPLYPALNPYFDGYECNPFVACSGKASRRQRRNRGRWGTVPRLIGSCKALRTKLPKDAVGPSRQSQMLCDEEVVDTEATSLMSDEEKENYEPSSHRLILSPLVIKAAHHHENYHESGDSTTISRGESHSSVNSSLGEDSSFCESSEEIHTPFIPEADGFEFTGIGTHYPTVSFPDKGVKRSVI